MNQGDVRRPRILVLAYACSPNHGSERAVGWHRAVQAARHFDTWVISEERWCAPDILGYQRQHGTNPGLRFHFVPKGTFLRTLGRVPGLYYLSYNLWQRRAFREARRLHAQLRFDLIHHVTYCGYREPGYLWKLEVPFVWGPVGGTQNVPWRFLREAGLTGGGLEACRAVLNAAQLRFSPRVRRAARRAARVFAANTTNQADLERAHGIRPALMLETGLRGVADSPRAARATERPLQILWSGDLRGFKGLSLLLKALAGVPPEFAYALRIVGSGPAGRMWQRLAARLGVDRQTQWLGKLSHPEALQQYGWADVFVFTSLRDTSGNAVLEALAAGVPVICLDHQGVRDIVDAGCGIKIPVTTPEAVVTGIRAALLRLATDPDRLQSLSHGALTRARRYLWTDQGDRMAAVYRDILVGRCVSLAADDTAVGGDYEGAPPHPPSLEAHGAAR